MIECLEKGVFVPNKRRLTVFIFVDSFYHIVLFCQGIHGDF